MKITIGVPSRGRPLELAASLISLEKTRSGNHDVVYLVALDEDDRVSAGIIIGLRDLNLPVHESFGRRPLGLGEIHNRLLTESDPESAFMLWSDRLVPGEIGWDHAIACAQLEFPNRVLWMDSVHLVGAGQFIITPKWRAALPDGKICPGLYPFWFEDTAVEEEDLLVHGSPRIQVWAKCAGPRVDRTNRMRDLSFWINVFARTRTLRIERAAAIRRALGLVKPPDHDQLVANFEGRDADFHARAAQLTEKYGALSEPDDSYFQARANAEKLLAAL